MLSAPIVLAIILFIFLLLILISHFASHNTYLVNIVRRQPIFYALGTSILFTSWTFYGSVGKAATMGMQYFSTYIGIALPTIIMWPILRRIVRIKKLRHITNIADFISNRYSKSILISSLVTLIALIGIMPYVALQLKAIFKSFALLSVPHDLITAPIPSLSLPTSVLITCLLIIATILIGFPKLNINQQHTGLLFTVALAGVIKLFCFLTIGIFVAYFCFDGIDDIFSRFTASEYSHNLLFPSGDFNALFMFIANIIIGMLAVICLPRQFHMLVVENTEEEHINTAAWFMPLYMLLITFFCFPIAIGGLLNGLPSTKADFFVLYFPLSMSKPLLTMIAFIGGLLASATMVIVAAISFSLISTNSFLLPLANYFAPLDFIKRYILQTRWIFVAIFIGLGFIFEYFIGDSYMLVNMGFFSFMAAAQFAPALLGGLYWKQANKVGAFLGLASGFGSWIYFVLLPAIIKSGWIDGYVSNNFMRILTSINPIIIEAPNSMHPVVIGTAWSLLLNVILFIVGSVIYNPTPDENKDASQIVDVLFYTDSATSAYDSKISIDSTKKESIIRNMLKKYFPDELCENIISDAFYKSSIERNELITLMKLATLTNEIEKQLTGVIGAVAANQAIKKSKLFSDEESDMLSKRYATIVKKLNIPPEELLQRINYYEERDKLLQTHASELKKSVDELKRHIKVRRQVEHELKVAKEKAESIFLTSPAAIYTVDHNCMVTSWNQMAENLTGYKKEDVLGKTCQTFSSPICRNNLCILHDKELKNIVNQEMILRRKDGSHITIVKNVSVLKDPQGYIIGAIECFLDITDRKKAEEDLIKFKRAVTQSSSMVIITNTSGSIEYVNPKFTQTTGYTLNEIIGKNPRILKSGDYSPEIYDNLWETISQGKEWRGTMHNRKKSGELYWVFASISPIRNTTNEITHYLSIQEDITKQKQDQEALIKAKEELEIQAWGLKKTNSLITILYKQLELKNQELLNLDKLKSDFISTVSHELRTPLTVIREGVSQVFDGLLGEVNSEQKDFLDLTLKHIDRLARLINDLLDMSKIEAGKVTLNVNQVNLKDLIYESTNSFEPRLKEKHIELKYDLPNNDIIIPIDKDKIIQVFTNLMANAIKFTENGIITIKIEEHEKYFECSVQDTGIGIAEEHIDKLFDKFHQVGRINGPGEQGTGLGLSIAKGIIELHGGHIWATSKPNIGTKIYFTLPKMDNKSNSQKR